MALSGVTINVNRNGIGRPLETSTHYSGMIFLQASAPTNAAFGTIKEVRSLQQAEDLGIVSSSADYNANHYHISEFFRIAPKGVLFITYADSATVTANADKAALIQTLQTAAIVGGIAGQLRQVVMFDSADYDASLLAAIQLKLDALKALKMPVIAGVVTQPPAGWADYSDLPDFSAATSYDCSFIVTEDNNGRGKALATSRSEFISHGGVWLGLNSLLEVAESIGSHQLANITDGAGENESVRYVTGEVYTIGDAENTAIEAKRLTFASKHSGELGTFFDSGATAAIKANNDFTEQELNRVMNEAIRLTNVALLQWVNRKVLLNGDGTLSDGDSFAVVADVSEQLQPLQSDGQVSSFSVEVDGTENVASTQNLTVTIDIVPTGTTKTVTANISFKVN